MAALILVFLTSFIVVLYSTPALIKVAVLKRLIDTPSEERKIHKRSVPTIGGIIIYAGTLFAYALWYNIQDGAYYDVISTSINEFKLIIATSLILFFVGVKDDIIGTAPVKKLFAHIIVALILVLMGNIRITGLHGIFGVSDLPYWGSVFISIFTYVVVVNAFNLIDGVDGLAAGIGFLSSCAFGTWFIFANEFGYATLSFALAGALGGFLIFNFSPAKIFMGDSGSLVIGMFICVLAIKMIEFPISELDSFWVHISKPVFAISALAYPLLDTLRVFIIRAVKGQSPFNADRNHLHHKLIDCDYSHIKTVIIIYSFSVITVGTSLLTYYFYTPTLSLLTVVGTGAVFLLIVININKKKLKKKTLTSETLQS
ncbi:glycosyltransferase family 4 protein [Aurantibacillus circumpalustris]|uniref:glycosyltransferase family 4 protein n=1 Tax=Aurantibacillus circumpalustris TaxID=3036359 RepID=UPI00295B28C5|nr:MraY family glycosyltransferase [Aurantibacillus circumpalustris]